MSGSALRRPQVWTVSWAVWTGIGVLLLANTALQSAVSHQPLTVGQEAGPTFASVWLWAVFTPPAFWLVDAFPVRPERWLRALALHVGVGLGFAAADSLWTTQLLQPLLHWDRMPLAVHFARQLVVCLTSYSLMVSVRLAMNNQRLETELARTRWKVLQAQLQPHFLFNALHTVASLVRADEGSQAIKTLAELGSLLRCVLEQEERQEVPLREELELLQRYLDIEQTRFQDRLSSHVSVAPEALEALVPGLILQPLVENAVRHGLSKLERPGRIDVTVRVAEQMLHIEVRDNGSGPSAELRNGIGLGNTRARLAHLYGKQQRLLLAPGSEGGAVASLRIPFRTAPARA